MSASAGDAARKVIGRVRAVLRAFVEPGRVAIEVARLRARSRALEARVRCLEPLPELDTTIAFAHRVDHFWCDKYGFYFLGWVHCFDRRLLRLEIEIGESRIVVDTFHDRPDLLDLYPEYPHVVRTGFEAWVPSRPGSPISWVLVTDRGSRRIVPDLPEPQAEHWVPTDMGAGFDVFIGEMKKGRGRVLEIGSRLVSPDAQVHRSRFPSYVGTDIFPARNVDVVTDAHVLSRTFAPGSFDGVFSLNVLEHLAAPWLLAREINAVLKTGGLTYHVAPHTWPIHEMPNDFWRFSDRGLSLLFGPAAGYDVQGAEGFGRVFVHPDCRASAFIGMPVVPSVGEAWVLSRKVRAMASGEIAWPMEIAESSRRALSYPTAS